MCRPAVEAQPLESRCQSAPAQLTPTCSVLLHRRILSSDNIDETMMMDAPPLVIVGTGIAAAIEAYFSSIDTESSSSFPASFSAAAAAPSPPSPSLDRFETCPPWFISCAPLECNGNDALTSEDTFHHETNGHRRLSGISTSERTSFARLGRRASSCSEIHMLGGWGEALLVGE